MVPVGPDLLPLEFAPAATGQGEPHTQGVTQPGASTSLDGPAASPWGHESISETWIQWAASSSSPRKLVVGGRVSLAFPPAHTSAWIPPLLGLTCCSKSTSPGKPCPQTAASHVLQAGLTAAVLPTHSTGPWGPRVLASAACVPLPAQHVLWCPLTSLCGERAAWPVGNGLMST